jgi:hypothetical protein
VPSSCALDEAALRAQRERYRRAGESVRLVARTRREVVVDLDEHVDTRLVDELVAVERACCPFFTLDWEAERRQLIIRVSQAEYEPALDAIAFALDVETPGQHAASD